mmetsp:Transcript_2612/g.3153  ORF Transcript_2612/g.3153 Transcript_2612/m.3153 type:complete len:126 (+) Transcript_2612:87-464(+)
MSFILLNQLADSCQFSSFVLTSNTIPSADKAIQKNKPNVFYFSPNSSSIQSHNLPPDPSRGSCRECLITGVLTCTGLSGYFFKLAAELPDIGAKEATKQIVRNKYFLYCGSATWAAAGVYRIYLG